MENKTNIAELLKDCPKGMELDSTMYDNCTLEIVFEGCLYPIQIQTPEGLMNLTKYGSMSQCTHSKCVIFPKGKTTWKGFVPPCKFKDGDIIFTHTNTSKGLLEYSWISIFKEYRNNRCACYVCLCLSDLKLDYDKWEDMLLCELCEIEESRLATEEEKRKLFDAIKANGYRWNAETKTLEKLPKFKVGDVIVNIYRKHLNGDSRSWKIYQITNDKYIFTDGSFVYIQDQNNWELVSNKFDINTLVPFESRVLVREDKTDVWQPAFYGFFNQKNKRFYTASSGTWLMCIPYNEDTKHLTGTTNDCDDFYKTWEK